MDDQELAQWLAATESDRSERTESTSKTDKFGEAICAFANDLPGHAVKTVAFFNHKGGVGKTTLTYHLAWMFHHLGVWVLVADLDPQANLTAAFLDDDRLEALWSEAPPKTIAGAILPLLDRLGDFAPAHVEDIDGIGLIPGDLSLSGFEDRLAQAWPACLDDNRAYAQDPSALLRHSIAWSITLLLSALPTSFCSMWAPTWVL